MKQKKEERTPLKSKIERRVFSVECRQNEDNETKIEGYAAIFNSDADIGPFIERIEQGAFTEAIPISDVRALFNHDSNFLLARKHKASSERESTLSVIEDEKGLKYRFVLPQSRGDIKEMIERGDLSQSSFAFTVKDAEWRTEGERDVRVIKKIDRLFDVSAVTTPAYEDTDVAIRSHEEYRSSIDNPNNPTPTPGQGKEATTSISITGTGEFEDLSERTTNTYSIPVKINPTENPTADDVPDWQEEYFTRKRQLDSLRG